MLDNSQKEPVIALVDDDPSVRRALCRLLRLGGFVAEVFSSGEEFIEQVQVHPPDCLLLDMQLPGLTGFDVLRHLVAMQVRFPVIIITGKDRVGLEEKSLASGASGFLLKPLDDGELLEAVRRAMRSSLN